MTRNREVLDNLSEIASDYAHRAYVPYSDEPAAGVVLLADGSWVPGVRVENASYSLTIPAVVNALTTVRAMGRDDIVAVTSSRPLSGVDRLYLAPAVQIAVSHRHVVHIDDNLPTPAPAPLQVRKSVGDPDAGVLVEEARKAATQAYAPESNFQVGSVLLLSDGGFLVGCNIERTEWHLSLCAERNVMGTAISYGLSDWSKLVVSCPKDPNGTPCGSCRQVLVEFAPDLEVLMDRGNRPPDQKRGSDLLPDYFSGSQLPAVSG